MRITKALRPLFDGRFLKSDFLPKVESWDATDEEVLGTHLADGTDWVVVLPTWINPRVMPATWLIAHGLAIPFSFWKADIKYRLFVLGNAWREMFGEGSPYFNNTGANWTRRLQDTHRVPELEGFKIFRWKASAQKAAILSKMRRVYLEALEEAGSMSAVDTINCMHEGAHCGLDYRSLPASADAIEKSLLFIGTQLNWIRNPAFLRDSVSHSFCTPNIDPSREEFNAIKNQYICSDVVYADMPSISHLMALTGASGMGGKEHLALPLINYYAGTQIFAWSILYSEALAMLPTPASSGNMGDVGNNVFMAIAEKSLLKGVTGRSIGGDITILNELDAFHAVTAFDLYPYNTRPPGPGSYIKFAHTWLGQVSSRALYLSSHTQYKYEDTPIINREELSKHQSFKAVLDYMEATNFNLRGANPASTRFTNLPAKYFPNIMNPEHAHSLLTISPRK